MLKKWGEGLLDQREGVEKRGGQGEKWGGSILQEKSKRPGPGFGTGGTALMIQVKMKDSGGPREVERNQRGNSFFVEGELGKGPLPHSEEYAFPFLASEKEEGKWLGP